MCIIVHLDCCFLVISNNAAVTIITWIHEHTFVSGSVRKISGGEIPESKAYLFQILISFTIFISQKDILNYISIYSKGVSGFYPHKYLVLSSFQIYVNK